MRGREKQRASAGKARASGEERRKAERSAGKRRGAQEAEKERRKRRRKEKSGKVAWDVGEDR